mgnify:CR=1 FL=1
MMHYQPVKEEVEAADLALVTQETVFVEKREDISGYPASEHRRNSVTHW